MSSDQQYPYDPHDPSPYPGRPHAEGAFAEPFPAGADAVGGDVAQTWEGQTWDTNYQPVVRPRQPQPQPPYGSGGYPLPPEAPAGHQAGYDAPTAYLPPVTGHGPAPAGHGQAAHAHGQAPAPAPGHAHGQAAPAGHQAGYDAPTAYLPPVTGHGPAPAGHGQAAHAHGQAPAPAPGHAHGQAAPAGHQAGYDAPTAYLPPVTDHGPAPAGHGQAAHAAAPVHADPAPPAGPAAEPGYGSPTTLGSTRITDAQRARAEGRSPIIDPGVQPAGLTALLGVLLAGGAALGPYALLVPLVLLQAVTAAGWFRLNGMWPARQGIALAFLGGAVADAALLATGPEHTSAAILGTLGVWLLLVLALQLRSRAAAEERMYGLTATATSSALAVLAAGFLAADPDAVVAGALAAAAATVVRALPLPGPASPVAALLAGAGAGAAAGAVTGAGPQTAVLGLAAGVCALVGARVAAYDYPSRFVHFTAGVALPLTAAAPAVYLLGRALA